MEQIDNLLCGYKIIQDTQRFMFGIDAILLADFSKDFVRNGDSVIDLGTGTGIIPLLLNAMTNAKHFTALEIQEESVDMAKRSVELNNLQEKISVIRGDIKEVQSIFPRHSFEIVTCNPPYMINEHGEKNCNDAKTIARHEILCNLEDVICAADELLKPHGRFFMIHRPFRLPEIFASMNKHHLEPKRMQLVCPFKNTEPNIVLIEARKNARPRLKIEPQLIVYDKPGCYSEAVTNIFNSEKSSILAK